MGRSIVSMCLGFVILIFTNQIARGESSGYPALPVAPSGSPATDAGSATALRSVPSFVQRVLVPLLPASENFFSIEDLSLDSIDEVPAGFSVTINGQRLRIVSPSGDASGYAKVTFGGRSIQLTLVNLVPSSEIRDGKLDGYNIGRYVEKPMRGLDSYRVPAGFIRLTSANSDLWVSDHYRLSDFQCKLDGNTKFLVLRPEALIKLELMQDQLKAGGLLFERFTIMSGFRTPYYNSRIGNETSYSRHLYGDAMDIFIDRNQDGNMDDINSDGRVDKHDAVALLKVAETIDQSAEWGWLKGGAGVYKANAAHGPYVHVDVRGYVARWGV